MVPSASGCHSRAWACSFTPDNNLCPGLSELQGASGGRGAKAPAPRAGRGQGLGPGRTPGSRLRRARAAPRTRPAGARPAAGARRRGTPPGRRPTSRACCPAAPPAGRARRRCAGRAAPPRCTCRPRAASRLSAPSESATLRKDVHVQSTASASVSAQECLGHQQACFGKRVGRSPLARVR